VFSVSINAWVLSAALLCVPLTSPFAATMQNVQKQILVLIANGDYDQAIAAAQAFEPSHPNHTARVEFVKGMVAKAKGRNAEAAVAFRNVLTAQPDLVPARQQLAHVLFLDEEFDAARHHFDVLQSTTSDPRLRQLYAGYGRAIDAQRPWSLTGYFTLAPSSNINKGSGKDTATLFGNGGWVIPKDQQSKTGFGIAIGGHGTYAVKLDDGLSMVLGGGVDGRLYKDHENDTIRINASVKPTYTSGDFKVSLGPYVATSFSAYEHSLTQYGIDADFGVKLDQGLLFSGSVAALMQDFENKARNGKKFSIDASLTKSLNTTTVIGVTGGVVIEDAKRATYDHTDWTAGLNLGHEWGGGFITRGDVGLGQHTYDGVLAGKAENRSDWVYSAGVQISNRNFSAMGFMPVLNYNFTRQKSNDEYNDFTSHDVAITLSRAF
jgi:outer membrane protein